MRVLLFVYRTHHLYNYSTPNLQSFHAHPRELPPLETGISISNLMGPQVSLTKDRPVCCCVPFGLVTVEDWDYGMIRCNIANVALGIISQINFRESMTHGNSAHQHVVF